MLTPFSLAGTCWTRLSTLPPAKITVIDGPPHGDPATPAYICYYPDAGQALNARAVAAPGRLDWGFTLVCAGSDRDTCLWTVGQVRPLFAGWRPDPDLTATPLTEQQIGAAPVYDLQVRDDPRVSFTLRYTLITSRSLNG